MQKADPNLSLPILQEKYPVKVKNIPGKWSSIRQLARSFQQRQIESSSGCQSCRSRSIFHPRACVRTVYLYLVLYQLNHLRSQGGTRARAKISIQSRRIRRVWQFKSLQGARACIMHGYRAKLLAGWIIERVGCFKLPTCNNYPCFCCCWRRRNVFLFFGGPYRTEIKPRQGRDDPHAINILAVAFGAPPPSSFEWKDFSPSFYILVFFYFVP